MMTLTFDFIGVFGVDDQVDGAFRVHPHFSLVIGIDQEVLHVIFDFPPFRLHRSYPAGR